MTKSEENLPTIDKPVIREQAFSTEKYKIDLEMDQKVAMGFFTEDSSYFATRKRKRTPKIREIARVSLADSLDFEAFVVNESEGFVMIAGDSRVMPILAYSTEGELNPEDFDEVNGLKVWYQETRKQIDTELKEVSDIHPIVYNEWKKYTEDYDPNGRIWNQEVTYNPNTNCYEWYQYGQFMCNPYMSVYERQPLYSNEISWGQRGISNHLAPTNIWTTCSCNVKSPIGCGPVASAQTLRCFEANPNYSYHLMPQYSNACQTPTTSGEISLALLMYNSALAANTDFNFGTTCDGFKRHNYKSYDCDLDGCMEWAYTWYFRNWAWNNSDLNPNDTNYRTSNRYYSLGVYTPYGSTSNYNNGLKMITGLR